MDPTFFDDLINLAINSKKDDIREILEYGKANGFSPRSLDWILDEKDQDIKNILQLSYHPVMIKALQQYGLRRGIEQWNIAMHPFFSPDVVYDFFSPTKVLGIEKQSMDELVERTFSHDTMLLGSSFMFSNRDNLYFLFSKIERHEPDEDGFVAVKFIEQKVMSSDREGLDSVSGYIQEKFPQHNLFELLNLDPEEIL